jgi:hypothetical protein
VPTPAMSFDEQDLDEIQVRAELLPSQLWYTWVRPRALMHYNAVQVTPYHGISAI